jgi:hypothetical protein
MFLWSWSLQLDIGDSSMRYLAADFSKPCVDKLNDVRKQLVKRMLSKKYGQVCTLVVQMCVLLPFDI